MILERERERGLAWSKKKIFQALDLVAAAPVTAVRKANERIE